MQFLVFAFQLFLELIPVHHLVDQPCLFRLWRREVGVLHHLDEFRFGEAAIHLEVPHHEVPQIGDDPLAVLTCGIGHVGPGDHLGGRLVVLDLVDVGVNPELVEGVLHVERVDRLAGEVDRGGFRREYLVARGQDVVIVGIERFGPAVDFFAFGPQALDGSADLLRGAGAGAVVHRDLDDHSLDAVVKACLAQVVENAGEGHIVPAGEHARDAARRGVLRELTLQLDKEPGAVLDRFLLRCHHGSGAADGQDDDDDCRQRP